MNVQYLAGSVQARRVLPKVSAELGSDSSQAAAPSWVSAPLSQLVSHRPRAEPWFMISGSSHGMQPLKTQNYFYPWAATAFLPHKDCWSWCLTLHATHPEPNQLRCTVPWHLVGFLTAQLLATGQSSSAPGIIVSPQKLDTWSQLSKLEIPQKYFAPGDKISSVQWLPIWFVFYTTNPSLHLQKIYAHIFSWQAADIYKNHYMLNKITMCFKKNHKVGQSQKIPKQTKMAFYIERSEIWNCLTLKISNKSKGRHLN